MDRYHRFYTFGMQCLFLCNLLLYIHSFENQNYSVNKKKCFRPSTNAIMGLTVANYILQPFFSVDCGVPPAAAQLFAAAMIC